MTNINSFNENNKFNLTEFEEVQLSAETINKAFAQYGSGLVDCLVEDNGKLYLLHELCDEQQELCDIYIHTAYGPIECLASKEGDSFFEYVGGYSIGEMSFSITKEKESFTYLITSNNTKYQNNPTVFHDIVNRTELSLYLTQIGYQFDLSDNKEFCDLAKSVNYTERTITLHNDDTVTFNFLIRPQTIECKIKKYLEQFKKFNKNYDGLTVDFEFSYNEGDLITYFKAYIEDIPLKFCFNCSYFEFQQDMRPSISTKCIYNKIAETELYLEYLKALEKYN